MGLIVVIALEISACKEDREERKLISDTPIPIAELSPDSHDNVEISITGNTVEPEGGSVLLLDDGTGVIDVVLPETLLVRVGTRVSAQGILQFDGLRPLLVAQQWYYDSTRVPVRSP
ncbi:MAG: hypothetical protein R3284_04170 [Rubricoccaceae bacterium]|nr:hypothetical protein [Rubricoccaceae bacterium]